MLDDFNFENRRTTHYKIYVGPEGQMTPKMHSIEEPYPAFSIVIPVFNEAGAVEATIREIQEMLCSGDVDHELIVVDDGSSDGTSELLSRIQDIRLITHPNNLGYGASLKSGIRAAVHPLIVITDSDGTYPNHRIPELVSLCSDFDMVVGSRTGDNVQYPLIRKIPKFFLKRFAEWMARQPIPDMNSGMRVFRKDVAEKFIGIFPDGFSFTTTITLAMLTNRFRVKFVPIDYHARIGRSKIRPIADTLRFIQLILRTGMYFAPLRVFLPAACALLLAFSVSACYDIFVLANLTDKTLILFVAGLQTGMFALLADMIDKRNSS